MGQRAFEEARIAEAMLQAFLQGGESAIHARPAYFDWPAYLSSRNAGPARWISLL